MKRVLVVDDDKQMVKTLCDILRIHGWTAEALTGIIGARRACTVSMICLTRFKPSPVPCASFLWRSTR